MQIMHAINYFLKGSTKSVLSSLQGQELDIVWI